MLVTALLASTCIAADLGAMEPQASRYIFRQGDQPDTAGGAYLVQEVEAASPGAAAIRFAMGVEGPPARAAQPAEIRYGFLTTIPRQSTSSWSKRSDFSVLPDDLTLTEGQSVAFEVPELLNHAGGQHQRFALFRITYEGCGEYAVDGQVYPVHQLRLESRIHILQGSEPVAVDTDTMFEVAPALGWWVSSRSDGAPALVLTDAS